MQVPEIQGYGILSPLGTGAGSAIYKAICKDSRQVVALKWVPRRSRADDRYVRQAENEWNICRQLRHRNIVEARDFIKIRGLLGLRAAVLVMEFVEGRPLAGMTETAVRDLLDVFIQTAHALQHVHERGYVHCDLKPQNILVRTDGVVKLVDFGIAAPLGAARERVQGTVDFIAPEQTQPGTVDKRTDVFNLGATMYRMLTGHLLPTTFVVGSSSSPQPAQRMWSAITKLNPDVPEALSELVLACCQRRIQDRPAEVGEVAKKLLTIREQVFGEGPTAACEEGPP